ncbi:hypothetical protein J2785_007449, partial [Burkholderia ambifaria]
MTDDRKIAGSKMTVEVGDLLEHIKGRLKSKSKSSAGDTQAGEESSGGARQARRAAPDDAAQPARRADQPVVAEPAEGTADRYAQRVIVQQGDDAVTAQAAKNLVNKHPANTTLVKAGPEGKLAGLDDIPATGGQVKVQVVGHGDPESGTLGDADAATLAKQLGQVKARLGEDAAVAKVALVGCQTACGTDEQPSLKQQVQAELATQGTAAGEVKGRETYVKVKHDGRKSDTHAGDSEALPPPPPPPPPPPSFSAGTQARKEHTAIENSGNPFRSIDLQPSINDNLQTSPAWRVSDYIDSGELRKHLNRVFGGAGRDVDIRGVSMSELTDIMGIPYYRDEAKLNPIAWTSREGKVYVATDAPEYSVRGELDADKIRSTIVHESIHARSNNHAGLQDLTNKNEIKSNYNYDEFVTDYYAKEVYHNLYPGATYKTNYFTKGNDELPKVWGGNLVEFMIQSGHMKREDIVSTYAHGVGDFKPLDGQMLEDWNKYAKTGRDGILGKYIKVVGHGDQGVRKLEGVADAPELVRELWPVASAQTSFVPTGRLLTENDKPSVRVAWEDSKSAAGQSRESDEGLNRASLRARQSDPTDNAAMRRADELPIADRTASGQLVLADHLDRVSSPTYGSARMGSARSFDGSRLGLESDRLGARLRAGVYNESGSLHQGLAEADRVLDGDTPRKRSSEHDSSTSLPVPSSSKLRKKPGLKLAIPLLSPLEERKKKYQQEGLLVASGSFGLVIRDPNDSSVLIKDMGKALDAAKMESSYFNKFYGANSSEVYRDDGGGVFLRMTKIPGTPVADLAPNDIPKNAMNLYLKMISDLGDLHLYHRDLHLSNVIYDADNERFWPIDFEDVVDYGDGEHLQFQAKDIIKFEELIKKIAMLTELAKQGTDVGEVKGRNTYVKADADGHTYGTNNEDPEALGEEDGRSIVDTKNDELPASHPLTEVSVKNIPLKRDPDLVSEAVPHAVDNAPALEVAASPNRLFDDRPTTTQTGHNDSENDKPPVRVAWEDTHKGAAQSPELEQAFSTPLPKGTDGQQAALERLRLVANHLKSHASPDVG